MCYFLLLDIFMSVLVIKGKELFLMKYELMVIGLLEVYW